MHIILSKPCVIHNGDLISVCIAPIVRKCIPLDIVLTVHRTPGWKLDILRSRNLDSCKLNGKVSLIVLGYGKLPLLSRTSWAAEPR